MSESAALAEAGWRRHLLRQLLQAAVWGGYGALSAWMFIRVGGPHSGLAMIALLLAAGLWTATEVLRSEFRRRGWLRLAPAALALRLLAMVAALAAAIQLLIFVLLQLGLATRLLEMPGGVSGYTPGLAIVYWINTGLMLLLWGTVWVGYAALRQSRQDVLARLRAEAEHRRLELESLRARLNPHFVFNALNNVRALINEDPDRARELVTRLSNTLRHALQHSQRERVSLAEEWVVMQDYLAVEAVQFERRLQVEAELDPALAGIKLPPMLLQLLVENAIKHGIASAPGGGLLRVEARRNRQGGLHLRVENPGRLQDMPDGTAGTGVGLAWLRAQIEGLGPSAHFRLRAPRPGCVQAELVLPG